MTVGFLKLVIVVGSAAPSDPFGDARVDGALIAEGVPEPMVGAGAAPTAVSMVAGDPLQAATIKAASRAAMHPLNLRSALRTLSTTMSFRHLTHEVEADP
jgi:hypothetical protein